VSTDDLDGEVRLAAMWGDASDAERRDVYGRRATDRLIADRGHGLSRPQRDVLALVAARRLTVGMWPPAPGAAVWCDGKPAHGKLARSLAALEARMLVDAYRLTDRDGSRWVPQLTTAAGLALWQRISGEVAR
jgi:hypothetical protein